MKSAKLQSVCAVLVLLGVAVVFFAPSVDLEPSALRASRAASCLLWALAAAAGVLSLLLRAPGRNRSLADLWQSPEFSGPGLVDLNCARLC